MHVSHIIRKSMKRLGRKPPVCVTRVVSVAVRGFLFTPWNAPPGDPRPPSVSFPGSSLQARGGRVPLHVSPEMSHSPQTRTRLLPHSPVVASPLRQFAFASPPPAEEGTRPGETRRGGRGCVSMHVCVCNCSFCVYECSSLWKFWVRDEVCKVSSSYEALRPAWHSCRAQRGRWLSHSCQLFSSNKDKSNSD